MKRLAVLAFLSVVWSGSALPAADPLPLPLPTGMASTKPVVPVPLYADGVVIPAGGAARDSGGDGGRFGPRIFGGMSRLLPCGGTDDGMGETYQGKPRWCENCAPAVRHPLPPLPANVGGGTRVVEAGGVSAGVTCAGGGCATGKADGRSCWRCFKDWLCFRQTPNHLPLKPTPRYAPFYTYFPCNERPGCGACGAGGCTTGGVAAGAAGRCAGGGCTPCPTPGEAVMPGYRLAQPEDATAGGAPAAGPVVTSSYKVPAAAPAGSVQPAGQYVPTPKLPTRTSGK